MDRARALVVDKDFTVRAVVREVLEEQGVPTLEAGTETEAVDALKKQGIDLVLVGVDDSDPSAAVILGEAARLEPPPLTVGIVDGTDAIERLLGAGLFDVVAKPLRRAEMRILAHRVRNYLDATAKVRRLQRELQGREGYRRLVGPSATMERLREQIQQLAPTGAGVWLAGEEGAGKELAARTLHELSPRRDGAFVIVSCAGLSSRSWDQLWLASSSEGGLLERARGGTLYLDGATELSVEMQQRVLQSLLEHLAGEDSTQGVRVLAASTWEPRVAIQQGRLLEEFFVGLTRTKLQLPALVERREDVAPLASHFVARIREINHLPPLHVSPEAMQVLEGYSWPGNVQELRNAIEHAAILAVDAVIRPRDLPERLREAPGSGIPSLEHPGLASREFREVKREIVESFEQAYLSNLLENHGGNVTSAAQQAGMLRSALQRLLRKYALKSSSFRRTRGARRPAATGAAQEID